MNNIRRKEGTTSLVARLMATENIDVRFDYIKTAAFDLSKRQLILPIYENISNDMEETLLAHEVSHALHTDLNDWTNFVGTDNTKKQYANIIEDVRIEKLIRKRFPGIVRVMKDGYREMHDKDFFGIRGEDISEYPLIDRINLHFKSYGNVVVPFKDYEHELISKIANVETWSDVEQIVTELYNNPPKPEQKGEDSETEEETTEEETLKKDDTTSSGSESGDDTEEGSESGDDTEEGSESGDETEEGSESGDETNETEEKSASDDGSGTESVNSDSSDNTNKETEGRSTGKDSENSETGRNGGDNRKPVESKTQKNLDDNLESKTNNQNQNRYGVFPFANVVNTAMDENWKDLVIPAKTFIDEERNRLCAYNEIDIVKLYKMMNKENVKVINNMVKEFEIRKSAEEYRRTYTSQTGNLDSSALYKYKLTDDIFLTDEITEDGKNHGVVMYVDFSGSMVGENIGNSMLQIFNMIAFCTKVGIPYTVYAFSNSDLNRNLYNDFIRRNNAAHHNISNCRKPYDMSFDNSDIIMIEIINSSLGKKDWTFAMGLIAGVAYVHTGKRQREYSFFNNYSAGTPLNQALYIATKLIQDFQARNKTNKTIFMLYTDGSAGDYCSIYSDSGYCNNINSVNRYLDPVSHKVWNRGEIYCRMGTYNIQTVLTDRVRINTGAVVMGFDIVRRTSGSICYTSAQLMYGKNPNEIRGDRNNVIDAKTRFRKEGFLHFTKPFGFDSFTFVSSDNGIENVDIDDELKDDDNPSARKLQGAFMRANKKTHDSRFLVKKLMEVIG